MDGGNQTEVGPTVDMVEGDSPSPSYQGFSPTCASHASAKAIVQLMDDKGYDVDQGQVTTILYLFCWLDLMIRPSYYCMDEVPNT